VITGVVQRSGAAPGPGTLVRALAPALQVRRLKGAIREEVRMTQSFFARAEKS
jgi:hypothetical protein